MTTLEMLKEAYEEGHDKEAAFSLRETLRNIGSGTKDTVDILGKNIAYGASQAKETMKDIPGRAKNLSRDYIDLLAFKDYRGTSKKGVEGVKGFADWVKSVGGEVGQKETEFLENAQKNHGRALGRSALAVGATGLALAGLGYGGYRLAKGREEEPTKEANYKPRNTDIGNDLEYAKWLLMNKAKETMKEVPGQLKDLGAQAKETIKDIPGRAKNLSRNYIDLLAFKDYRGMSNKAKDYARQLKLMNLDPEYAYPSAIGEAEAFLRKRKGAFRNSALTVGGTALGLGALGYGGYRLAKGREEEPTKEANYKPRNTDIGNDLEYAKWLFGNKVKEFGGKVKGKLKNTADMMGDNITKGKENLKSTLKDVPGKAKNLGGRYIDLLTFKDYRELGDAPDFLRSRKGAFRNSALAVGGTALGLGALGYGAYRLANSQKKEEKTAGEILKEAMERTARW